MTVDRSRLARDGRQISIQMEQMANRCLDQAGMTGVQAQMLLYLLRHGDGGISVTELHQASGYSKATISNLVKRLREISPLWEMKQQGIDLSAIKWSSH